ncbi:MAG: hypothetical protein E5W70_27715 [Mesorhizobium sp.]|uniref:hypothetical protein n=1 Tax=Mesorhizobium sp. TaxID=1871066 RepID=UPI0011FF7F11|nr:hypothetical protein [Mesorhizobium sp.]TIT18841.1 MAG: hypothetical protein E5W70_27715 [Mesorhizobium sp.]
MCLSASARRIAVARCLAASVAPAAHAGDVSVQFAEPPLNAIKCAPANALPRVTVGSLENALS